MHKLKQEPKQATQVPKRNNRNSFTARVGRKKKKDNNKNKLNFENDLIQDENDIDIDINIDPNRNINLENQKLENDFVE